MRRIEVVLASTSPRRRDLLRMLVARARVVDPGPVERSARVGDDPAAYALEQAVAKLRPTAARTPEALTLAADTIVCVDGLVLGKPVDQGDARRMLRRLSARDHEVITAVALGWRGQERTGLERTRVEFRPLSEEEIARYVESGEPMEKAGAYGIQGRGAIFLRKVEGCFFNVVGLPLTRLIGLLAELGLQYDLATGDLLAGAGAVSPRADSSPV